MFHGVGRWLAQRRHRGVVQIDQPLAHRELVCVNLPERGLVCIGSVQFIAPFIYNTVLGTFMKRSSAAILFLMFFAAAYGAEGSDKKSDPTQIGNRDVGKGVNFYSLEKEIALGRQLAQEVQRQAKMVGDPLIAEFVNRIGQNLARNSDAKVPFTFYVVDSSRSEEHTS